MFREKYRADNEKIKADDALKYYIGRKLEAGAPPPGRPAGRTVIRMTAVALSLALVCGTVWLWHRTAPTDTDSAVPAATYAELYNAVKAVKTLRVRRESYWEATNDGYVDDHVDPGFDFDSTGETQPGAIIAENSTDTNDEHLDHSETNTQVAGVDEGDVVKTDGKYLYHLRWDDVRITRLDGAQTAPLARLQTAFGERSGGYVTLYLADGQLAVIRSGYSTGWRDASVGNTELRSMTGVELYDVSDPAAPQLRTTLWQTGHYLDSRVTDGRLYLFTQDAPCMNFEKTDPATFVPSFGETSPTADTCRVADPAEVLVLDHPDGERYIVAAAVDLKAGEMSSTLSLFGWYGALYASTQNLYWMMSDETAKGGVVTNLTRIKRIRFSDGSLTLTGEAEVPGKILNQFSCDEADGYFRLVTTVNHLAETQGRYGDTAVTSMQRKTDNGLYVLDADFQLVGSLTGLAEEERVYSVRFIGDTVYFVTFRETDPLFSVDLSDPANPKLMGALKIPGFSTYLHPYSATLLFGLGYATTDDGARTKGLKLSMFDISDPYDVTEIDKLELDVNDSEAAYNHKAILIQPSRDLIGFSGSDNRRQHYLIYGYTPERGFYQRAALEIADWEFGARAVYAGDYLYTCANQGVAAYRMSDFTRVGAITY